VGLLHQTVLGVPFVVPQRILEQVAVEVIAGSQGSGQAESEAFLHFWGPGSLCGLDIEVVFVPHQPLQTGPQQQVEPSGISSGLFIDVDTGSADRHLSPEILGIGIDDLTVLVERVGLVLGGNGAFSGADAVADVIESIPEVVGRQCRRCSAVESLSLSGGDLTIFIVAVVTLGAGY